MKRTRETKRMSLQRVQSLPSASTSTRPKRLSMESQTLLFDMETFKKQKTEGLDVKKIHARHLQKIGSRTEILLDNVEDTYLYRLNFV
jgi:hypothetical protein